jgi:hypothetical protein
MGLGMIEAKEMSIISSMMDDIKALKKRVEEMEERFQTLADMHRESELEVRDEYLSHLDELDEKGEFEDFSDIGELRRRIENAEC